MRGLRYYATYLHDRPVSVRTLFTHVFETMKPDAQEDTAEFASFREFQKLGFIIGGILPIFVYLFFSIVGLEDELIRPEHTGFFLLLSFVGMALGIGMAHLEHEHSRAKWFGSLFFFQAVYSAFLIHLLVLCTGGAKSSVFALSYMYLPAVVGATYGSGPNLKGATIFSCMSYLANVFFVDFQSRLIFDKIDFVTVTIENASFTTNGLAYAAVFVIQLVCTAWLSARKGKDGASAALEI